jgi:hypothetical protein
MRLGALVAVVALSGPVWAEGGPPEESLARFREAVAAAGCTVTEANQKTVLAEAGMDETEAGVIASVLVERGEALLDGSTLRLTVAPCG